MTDDERLGIDLWFFELMDRLSPEVSDLADRLLVANEVGKDYFRDDQLGLVVTLLKVFMFFKYSRAPWSGAEGEAKARDDLMEEIQKTLGETEFERCLRRDPRLAKRSHRCAAPAKES